MLITLKIAMTLDNWQRIEQIIKWAGFPSVSAFARAIGLPRSENLYQIKRGNNGISRDLSETITAHYPELSRAWLLTGEGSMLRSDHQASAPPIPFFRADAVEVSGRLDSKPDYDISFPVFDGCDFAALSMSQAMEPEVLRGSILFFASADPSAAIPGDMYLILSPRFSGIRYLRRATVAGDVRLVPANRKDFDEVILPVSEISGLYLVRGVVKGKGI